MDQLDTTPARGRHLARWGAIAGGLAVVGGLTAGGAAAFAASEPAPATTTAAAAPVTARPAVAPATATAAATADCVAPPVVDVGPAVTPEAAAYAAAQGVAAMPDGYTAQQYETFWGAGYTSGDVLALADLWQTDETSAKARAGQLLLDCESVPVAPGSSPEAGIEDADPLWTAFSEAGYTYDDAVALAALWTTDVTDAKARIGRAVLDGEPLPVAPGSSPAAG